MKQTKKNIKTMFDYSIFILMNKEKVDITNTNRIDTCNDNLKSLKNELIISQLKSKAKYVYEHIKNINGMTLFVNEYISILYDPRLTSKIHTKKCTYTKRTETTPLKKTTIRCEQCGYIILPPKHIKTAYIKDGIYHAHDIDVNCPICGEFLVKVLVSPLDKKLSATYNKSMKEEYRMFDDLMKGDLPEDMDMLPDLNIDDTE